MELDAQALNNLPENGPLPGTVVETENNSSRQNQETSDGPAVTQLSDDTDCIRPSVLTLGKDNRNSLERLAAATGGEHHVHVRLNQLVAIHKKQHWKVRFPQSLMHQYLGTFYEVNGFVFAIG